MSGGATYLSPLRYPGGKAKLAPYLARVLSTQSKSVDTYCEPYAGGAGAGLHLLWDGHVDKLIINDLNPGIAAFWRSVFFDAEALVDLIADCAVDLNNWHRQRAVYQSPSEHDDLALGFATFFLNRTNRSGILNARPIGGLEQTGKWLIDARFNKADLTTRVLKLGAFASQVDIRQDRAIDLIRTLNRRKRPVLLYVDPPYVVPGEELYMTEHSWSEHQKLAQALENSQHPWILTYDADDRTRELYRDFRCLRFGISHTAQVQKIGREFMFFSRGLRVPDRHIMRDEGEWVPARSAAG
ncbi:DNA adenine methylase [Mycobacteroides abscessus]|uniref:DNA adenine methylase n=1 Tax=Mycobacteroides abscessus TaxID=36809 RepID=UPI0009A7DCF6|nr:DNA adenine methylase [Mycobacteroides abscessus]RIT47245.1 DNA adenine methylase [Mycobacteroides abscessus]SKF91570.1 D12 class N6 adenine-specific DNA methyltransferase [Mycobacteroides abscessus subsp. massiliense]SKG05493.1 D12 class N6 adenine-specific DNA methyltransferase [Mycobacteroides abscessus subsp. massiliense]SKG23752.1 D12 class N6 adenine-specific DNA methyltransferase [Mycobacteroides abscessus subsp. massiliense]SKG76888.1 D12 class N6 adenine-specific DNA methyltransfer